MNDALVPIAPTEHARSTGRPHADFIAHLIATSIQAPQTCARRRAAPEVAVAAYGALDRVPAAPGRAVSRSL